MAAMHPSIVAAKVALEDANAVGDPLASHEHLIGAVEALIHAIEHQQPPAPDLSALTGDPAARATACAGLAHMAHLDMQLRLNKLRDVEDLDDQNRELLDLAVSVSEFVGALGLGILHALRAQAPTRPSFIGARIGEPRPAGGA